MAKSIYIQRQPGESVPEMLARSLKEPTMPPDQRQLIEMEIRDYARGFRSVFDSLTKGVFVMQTQLNTRGNL